MFKHYFEGISGIEIYPIFLLIVFITFFVSISIWLMKTKKSRLDEISRLPLQDKNHND
jgi:cytochrome c oxidase cbb3-type subunit 4